MTFERMFVKIWYLIEKCIRFIAFKIFRFQFNEELLDSILQFVKFGFVGILNNVISFITYIVLVRNGIHYTPANIIGFTVSVFNSYYWNNKYVFAMNSRRVWWKTFLKTYISYAGTGILLSNTLLIIWIEVCGISKTIAPLINIIVTIPINFLVNKYWAYRK